MARCFPVALSSPWAAAKVSRISVQVSESQVPKESGIHPTAWWTSLGCAAGSSPAMRIEPASGARSAASMRRRVVLPAPLEPTSPVTVPLGTVMFICQTARVGPKKRVTPVTSMLMRPRLLAAPPLVSPRAPGFCVVTGLPLCSQRSMLPA